MTNEIVEALTSGPVTVALRVTGIVVLVLIATRHHLSRHRHGGRR